MANRDSDAKITTIPRLLKAEKEAEGRTVSRVLLANFGFLGSRVYLVFTDDTALWLGVTPEGTIAAQVDRDASLRVEYLRDLCYYNWPGAQEALDDFVRELGQRRPVSEDG